MLCLRVRLVINRTFRHKPTRAGDSITLQVPPDLSISKVSRRHSELLLVTLCTQLLQRLPKRSPLFEGACRLRGDVYAEWLEPELTVGTAFKRGILRVGVPAHVGFAQPFAALDQLLPQETLQALGQLEVLNDLDEFDVVDFNAAGGKHANAIELQDCVGWPAHFDFDDSRLHRGNDYYWKDNANSVKLARLHAFVKQLPFFEQTGKVTVIHNVPGMPGMEHCDHKIPDLVSEFVWFRCDAKKQFFVRDTQHGYPWFVDCKMIWFHDRLSHNIEPIDEPCFSVRVDGKFSGWFRDYLARTGYFYDSDLRKVMAGQDRWASTPTRWPEVKTGQKQDQQIQVQQSTLDVNGITMASKEACKLYIYQCAIK